VSQDLLIINVSRSHTDAPHSVGLLWTSDKPDEELKTPKSDSNPRSRRDSN